MMFIPGVISIIIQENILCASKIRVIYFYPNCVNFSPEIFLFLFLGGQVGGRLPSSLSPSPSPHPSSCAYGSKYGIYDCILKIQKNRTKSVRFYLRFEQNTYRSLRLKQCVLGSKIWGFYPQGTHLENNLVEIQVTILKKFHAFAVLL